ncbi:ABC transporter permease [Xylocopilactobacillus apicola]|uniref:ABC transporter permease n=1 Tax=Xylocopilactobacillus apicola TaxID=2932184 RepID=UPI002952C6A5|nr:ABC transporter permease [Xylocopilactobacillus apicola]
MFSLFLSWFVLYNLGMLTFTERYREYATMRVLGFRLNEIRSIIVKDNLLTWVEGTVIGIPLGLAFLKVYVSIADSDTSEFFSYISIGGLVIAGGILFVNVVLIAWLISHHIKQVDMASALKSID